MGQLRFYPKSLRASDIEEIFQYGTRLSDMSTGCKPPLTPQATNAGAHAHIDLCSDTLVLSSLPCVRVCASEKTGARY